MKVKHPPNFLYFDPAYTFSKITNALHQHNEMCVTKGINYPSVDLHLRFGYDLDL
jgi:hypothetical protein